MYKKYAHRSFDERIFLHGFASNGYHSRLLSRQLSDGNPASHGKSRLVLLHSCPDTVHRFPLHRNPHVNTSYSVLRHNIHPLQSHHPCCSGLQVQGTAISPASASDNITQIPVQVKKIMGFSIKKLIPLFFDVIPRPLRCNVRFSSLCPVRVLRRSYYASVSANLVSMSSWIFALVSEFIG